MLVRTAGFRQGGVTDGDCAPRGAAKTIRRAPLRLAFISPAVAEAIASGGARLGINLQMLMDGRCALPLDWQDQQAML